jgi:hypothetical protein
MNRSRTLVFCILSALAVGLVGMASAASAFTPERGTCKTATKGHGEYLNDRCTELGEKGGTGKEFVWEPVSKATAFTSTTGEATIEAFTPEGAEEPGFTCTKSKGKGKILTATTSETVITFEGCTVAGEKCTGGAKATAGEIVTFPVDGTLGTIGGGSGVGERLNGAGPEGLFAEFKCGANEIKWRSGPIGELTPTNEKASAAIHLSFVAEGGTQEFEEINGESGVYLESEIDGLGSGTFPFKVTVDTSETVKGTAYEVRS